MPPKPLIVLGLETSCDETAAAVVRGVPPGPGEILSNVMFSQVAEHRPYGGVVPEIAARAHVELLDGVIARALDEAGVALGDVDAVAATAGPGLIGGVMVGLVSAKALALACGKPLIAVNHLEAHALSARLSSGTEFPFLLLLISGGHCQLMAAEGVGAFRLYGATIDDAVGEAFDKTAKLLGLPYPGGPEIERLARAGHPKRFSLPRPMIGREGVRFLLLRAEDRGPPDRPGEDASDRSGQSGPRCVFPVSGCRCAHRPRSCCDAAIPSVVRKCKRSVKFRGSRGCGGKRTYPSGAGPARRRGRICAFPRSARPLHRQWGHGGLGRVGTAGAGCVRYPRRCAASPLAVGIPRQSGSDCPNGVLVGEIDQEGKEAENPRKPNDNPC